MKAPGTLYRFLDGDLEPVPRRLLERADASLRRDLDAADRALLRGRLATFDKQGVVAGRPHILEHSGAAPVHWVHGRTKVSGTSQQRGKVLIGDFDIVF